MKTSNSRRFFSWFLVDAGSSKVLVRSETSGEVKQVYPAAAIEKVTPERALLLSIFREVEDLELEFPMGAS